MKRVLGFLKTTLLGGVMFLLPLVLTIVLLRHALKMVSQVVHPIAQELPVSSVLGVHVADLLGVLLLVAPGFLAGLVARTGAGSKLSQRLEQLVLRKIPGYTLLKGVTGGAGAAEVQVALARFDDNTVLGFIMEKSPDGLLTVFVPSAPTPAAGTVFYLPEDRVTRLNVPVADATKVIMRLGVGSSELLSKPGTNAPSVAGPPD